MCVCVCVVSFVVYRQHTALSGANFMDLGLLFADAFKKAKKRKPRTLNHVAGLGTLIG